MLNSTLFLLLLLLLLEASSPPIRRPCNHILPLSSSCLRIALNRVLCSALAEGHDAE